MKYKTETTITLEKEEVRSIRDVSFMLQFLCAEVNQFNCPKYDEKTKERKCPFSAFCPKDTHHTEKNFIELWNKEFGNYCKVKYNEENEE